VIISLLFLCTINARAQQNPWKYSFGSNPNLIVPVYYNGLIYVASETGQLSAIDSKNGKLAWSYKADAAIAQPPCFDGQTAFFCTKTGNVIAIDLNSHKAKWIVNAGDKLICTPLIFKDLVIVYSKNFLIAYDKGVGLDMWKAELKISGTPLLKQAGENFYFSDNMKIYAFNAQTGKQIWEFKLPVYGQSDLLINENNGFVINQENLYCIDLITGKEKWKKTINSDITSNYNNTPSILNNLLIVTYSQEVIAYTADKGVEQWRIKLKSEKEMFAPIIANSRIYIIERAQNIFVLSPEKGKKESTFTIPDPVDSVPIFQNQVVYYTTTDGLLVGFKLLTE